MLAGSLAIAQIKHEINIFKTWKAIENLLLDCLYNMTIYTVIETNGRSTPWG